MEYQFPLVAIYLSPRLAGTSPASGYLSLGCSLPASPEYCRHPQPRPSLAIYYQDGRYFRCNLPGRKATFYDYLLRMIRGEDGGFCCKYPNIDGHQYAYNDAIHVEHLYRVASQLTRSKAMEYNCNQYCDKYNPATWFVVTIMVFLIDVVV
jgi:hypothetical protein